MAGLILHHKLPYPQRIQGMGRPSQSNCDGFTMVEALVASVLISIVLLGTSLTLSVSNRANRAARMEQEMQRMIDEDIAAINDLNERYTCCPNTCTVDAAVIDAAKLTGVCAPTAVVGGQNYYTPVQNVIPNNGTYDTPMQGFRDACANGTLTNNLIAEFPPVPTMPVGGNLIRSNLAAALVDTDSHRLQWTYTGSINGQVVLRRVVNMIPIVASWCP